MESHFHVSSRYSSLALPSLPFLQYIYIYRSVYTYINLIYMLCIQQIDRHQILIVVYSNLMFSLYCDLISVFLAFQEWILFTDCPVTHPHRHPGLHRSAPQKLTRRVASRVALFSASATDRSADLSSSSTAGRKRGGGPSSQCTGHEEAPLAGGLVVRGRPGGPGRPGAPSGFDPWPCHGHVMKVGAN